jgi:hypothetical protein
VSCNDQCILLDPTLAEVRVHVRVPGCGRCPAGPADSRPLRLPIAEAAAGGTAALHAYAVLGQSAVVPMSPRRSWD